MGYYLSILAFAGINAIAVMGSFLLTGMTGMVSFGQAAMMGIGAYVSGVLTAKYGFPVLPAFLIALSFTAVFAAFLGSITLRLRQDFFALATFVFSEAMNGVLALATTITGGANGLFGIPMVVKTSTVWITLIVIILITMLLTFSGFGRRSQAIRDDALAADAMGIPVFRHRMTVFVITSVMAALAGCLYGHYTSFIDPSMFGWMQSAEWMLLVFVGGRGNLFGTLASSAILLALPEVLRAVNIWRTIVYGVLVLIMLNFRPEGLFGNFYAKTSRPNLLQRIEDIFLHSSKKEDCEG